MELTQRINDTYSTDLNRQYYVGSRDGSEAVWELMKRYPNRISAGICSAGSLSAEEYSESMAEIPLCIVNSKDDSSTMLCNSLLEKGAAHLQFTEITGYSETFCPLLADSENISTLTWLYDQSRSTDEDTE